MKTFSKIKLFLLTATATATITAQDLHFSQFNEAPLLVNPALTSVKNDIRASLTYRDQWRSVTSPYQTFGASYEMKLNKKEWVKVDKFTEIYKQSMKNLSAGIQIYRDKAGDGKMGSFQALLSLASHVRIAKEHMLSLGFMGGISQHTIDFSAFQWDSQYDGFNYDPTLSTGENFSTNNFVRAEFASGILWTFGKNESSIRSNNEFKGNLGIAGYHLNRPKTGFIAAGSDRMEARWVAHGNCEIGVKNTNLDILPSFLVNLQGPSKEIIFGSMLRYNAKEDSKYTGFVKSLNWSLGGYWRAGDSFILSTLLEAGQYAVGFSYDINASDLSGASTGRGGFEITLRFITPNPYLYSASRIR